MFRLNWKWHRYLGIVMLFPLLVWAATGVVFLTKPGYQGAYEMLQAKTHPLDKDFAISANDQWQQVRLLKTALGYHLLATMSDGSTQHLDPQTGLAKALPTPEQLKSLFAEAIAHNLVRYGEITSIFDTTALTSTGIKISLNWNTLSFDQLGTDRKIIDNLYRLHYLQWTPWPEINRVFGVLGLIGLTALTLLGLWMFFGARPGGSG